MVFHHNILSSPVHLLFDLRSTTLGLLLDWKKIPTVGEDYNRRLNRRREKIMLVRSLERSEGRWWRDLCWVLRNLVRLAFMINFVGERTQRSSNVYVGLHHLSFTSTSFRVMSERLATRRWWVTFGQSLTHQSSTSRIPLAHVCPRLSSSISNLFHLLIISSNFVANRRNQSLIRDYLLLVEIGLVMEERMEEEIPSWPWPTNRSPTASPV